MCIKFHVCDDMQLWSNVLPVVGEISSELANRTPADRLPCMSMTSWQRSEPVATKQHVCNLTVYAWLALKWSLFSDPFPSG